MILKAPTMSVNRRPMVVDSGKVGPEPRTRLALTMSGDQDFDTRSCLKSVSQIFESQYLQDRDRGRSSYSTAECTRSIVTCQDP